MELKVIWKDEEMFELKVTASNVHFVGSTEVYEQSEHLSSFASTLAGFPKYNKSLFYEIGKKDSYAYFSAKFYPIGTSGLVGVETYIESNVANNIRLEEKNKLKLEIIVEPNAIDNFQKELMQMARVEDGTAILYGNDNRVDN